MLQAGADTTRHLRKAPLRLRLLGRFEVLADNPRQQIAIISRKARALLVYLAMHPGERIARTQLANLLWGDRFDKQAKQSLRQCLAGLKQDLGELGERALIVDHEAASLDPAIVAVDALDFLAASKQASPTALKTATLLYASDLTTEFDSESEDFAEWSRLTRERLRAIAIESFESYVRHASTNGDKGAALEACERLLALDPLREATHRLILPLEAARNGRGAALLRFQQFEAVLKRELGVAPERATLDVLTAIRDGDLQVASFKEIEELQVGSSRALSASTKNSQANDGVSISRDPRRRRGGSLRPDLGIAAALLTALLFAGFWTVDGSKMLGTLWSAGADSAVVGNGPVGHSEAAHSIVVLPFIARGEDDQTRWFADVLTDELTADLSHTPRFVVISRQTAVAFRNTNRDAREIGKELGVNYLLTGSVSSTDGKTVVRVQLTDTRTGVQVWVDRIERDDAARYEVFEEIVHGLGRRLSVEINMAEGTRRERLERRDPTYSDLIHRGFAETLKPSLFDKPHSGALEVFEEALRRDPDSVPAMIGIVWTLTRRVAEIRTPDRAEDLMRAAQMIDRAIEIAPNGSSARFFLGVVRKLQGRHEEALAAFEHALRLNPSLAAAHAHFGHGLIYVGRAEEVEEHIRRAIRFSPRDPSLGLWQYFACEAAMALSRYDSAVEWCERSTAADPQVGRTYIMLAAAYTRKGELLKATAARREAQRLLPKFPLNYYRQIGGDAVHPRFIEQRANVRRDIELAFELGGS